MIKMKHFKKSLAVLIAASMILCMQTTILADEVILDNQIESSAETEIDGYTICEDDGITDVDSQLESNNCIQDEQIEALETTIAEETEECINSEVSVSELPEVENDELVEDELFEVELSATNLSGINGIKQFVTRLYRVCLGRNPDSSGFATWVNGLNNRTKTGTSVARGFIFSNEFKGKNYSNTAFVKQLYRAMFGREADTAGLNSWVKKLQAGASRLQVFYGFIGSDEFTGLCRKYGITKASSSELADASAALTAMKRATTPRTSRLDCTTWRLVYYATITQKTYYSNDNIILDFLGGTITITSKTGVNPFGFSSARYSLSGQCISFAGHSYFLGVADDYVDPASGVMAWSDKTPIIYRLVRVN